MPGSTAQLRLHLRQQGAVSMQLLIILVPVLFGLMGFAVDLGRLYLIKGELNQAASAMAMAAAGKLIGTQAALENAALAANQTIDASAGDSNRYNFGSITIGDSSGFLTSTVAAPTFFSSMTDAINSTSTNYADGTTATDVQINLQADAPLLFWSLLSLGQARKTTIGANAVAGLSAPLCTVCSMEDFAVAALDQTDTVNFGFTAATKYTFYFDCGAPTVGVNELTDATTLLPYVLIDRYNTGSSLDETQQLFRTGAAGLVPLPSGTTNRQMACFTVGAPEVLWASAVPSGSCRAAAVNTSVEQMLCGLYSRFDDPNNLGTTCASVTDISTISTAYTADTDTADYDDYTAYNGSGRRIITVPIVDTLATDTATTMNVLGFRQFFVTGNVNPTTGLGNDPTDTHGRFAAIYIGSIVPVKQGFYTSLPTASAPACGISSGPGKVVLHQ